MSLIHDLCHDCMTLEKYVSAEWLQEFLIGKTQFRSPASRDESRRNTDKPERIPPPFLQNGPGQCQCVAERSEDKTRQVGAYNCLITQFLPLDGRLPPSHLNGSRLLISWDLHAINLTSSAQCNEFIFPSKLYYCFYSDVRPGSE